MTSLSLAVIKLRLDAIAQASEIKFGGREKAKNRGREGQTDGLIVCPLCAGPPSMAALPFCPLPDLDTE